MSPPVFIILGLCIFFGAMASLLMIIAVSTDHWESVTFDPEALKAIEGIRLNESTFNETEGFYQIAVPLDPMDPLNMSTKIYYLRDSIGGIWRYCDKISESFRKSDTYTKAIESASYLKYGCFDYIPHYNMRKEDEPDGFSDTAVRLIRMQNSASSCDIVSLLCMVTAAIVGTFGLWQKQVSACMVTGVMYIVSGVFLCFSLVIMLTKIGYMRTECYTLDPLSDRSDLCNCRTTKVGWCIPLSWLAFSMFLLAFAFWQFLARSMRNEKAKAII